MSIALYGWRMSKRLLVLFIVLVAFSLTVILSSLILGNSTFGYQANNLVHKAPARIDQATLHATAVIPPRRKLCYGCDDYCDSYPDPGSIAIIIKTGATELHEKVPAQLSALQCVSDPLIFSDLEQQLGPYNVYDVLSQVTATVKAESVDFEIYRLQKQYATSGLVNDLRKLRNMSIANEDWRTRGKSAAWGLDKYKFLHMVERSWELAPNNDWYLFLEADTFLSWPNLLRWLKTLDPQEKWYLGNAVRMYEAPYQEPFSFGHGGAGVLLSGTAVREFAVTRKGLANRWEDRVEKMWFGDYVLAAALHEELKLDVTNTSPLMTENDPPAVIFSDVSWCRPIVTLHHIHPQLLDRLARWSSNNSILRYKDVFSIAFPRGFPDNRTHWDNLIEDAKFSLGNQNNGSYVACKQACQQNDQCMQFSYITVAPVNASESSTTCQLTQAFMLGKSREPESENQDEGSLQTWTSGWMTDRIAKWVEDHHDCSVDVEDWRRT